MVEITAFRLESNFPPMRALEFVRDHVTFKLPYDFSYHMKTPIKFCGMLWLQFFGISIIKIQRNLEDPDVQHDPVISLNVISESESWLYFMSSPAEFFCCWGNLKKSSCNFKTYFWFDFLWISKQVWKAELEMPCFIAIWIHIQTVCIKWGNISNKVTTVLTKRLLETL